MIRLLSRRNDVLFSFGQVGGNHLVVGKEESYPDKGQNNVNPCSETRGFLQSELLGFDCPILKPHIISRLFTEIGGGEP